MILIHWLKQKSFPCLNSPRPLAALQLQSELVNSSRARMKAAIDFLQIFRLILAVNFTALNCFAGH